ncbi:MAG: DUF6907 domain-containing protein [Actinomycetes bacterium]
MTSTDNADRIRSWIDGTLTPPPAPDCPDWCRMAAPHGWDSMHEDGRISRGHETEPTYVYPIPRDLGVTITSIEFEDGTSDGPGITLLSAEGDQLDAEQARRYALLLLEAAGRLDAIRGRS